MELTASSSPGRATAEALIEWGRERARVGPWRSDQGTALLASPPDAPPATAGFIHVCLDRLAEQGYRSVVTTALRPVEQPAYAEAGFEERERLHLLAHDLHDLPPRTHAHPLRRGGRGDRAAALAVDTAAFDPFWRLDERGLRDAMTATPTVRFRIATAGGEGLVAYAITGRAGQHGYLQRLAVDPGYQRRGVGLELTLDALHWMRRRGADGAVVNTQVRNRAALKLYEHVGFRVEGADLVVFGRDLRP
jgi:ribosomal protein S18 acetylase RimI-like enzyme